MHCMGARLFLCRIAELGSDPGKALSGLKIGMKSLPKTGLRLIFPALFLALSPDCEIDRLSSAKSSRKLAQDEPRCTWIPRKVLKERREAARENLSPLQGSMEILGYQRFAALHPWLLSIVPSGLSLKRK